MKIVEHVLISKVMNVTVLDAGGSDKDEWRYWYMDKDLERSKMWLIAISVQSVQRVFLND